MFFFFFLFFFFSFFSFLFFFFLFSFLLFCFFLFSFIFSILFFLFLFFSFNRRLEFYRQTASFFEKGRKSAPEELYQILYAVKYIFGKPKDAFSVASFLGLMNEVLHFFSKNKKSQFRLQAIYTLQRMISALYFNLNESELFGEEKDLWNNVTRIHQMARKWMTYPDLTNGAVQLIVTILTNGTPDYFNAHFEPFLQADVLSGKKLKLYSYEAILSMLRGKYQVESLENSWKALYYPYEPGLEFSFIMRPKSELDPTVTANRLDLIADLLFMSRTAPIEFDCLNICADILVQMAAYRYHLKSNS